MPKPRALMSWSSGKDAAWALHCLRQAGDVEVVGMLTTLNQEFQRVAMHAVRRTLLGAQAVSLGLPLLIVPLPWPCSNDEYEAAMGLALTAAQESLGVTHLAFGDLFWKKSARIVSGNCKKVGLTPLFPLWGLPTDALARDMIAGGLQARLTCVDPSRLLPSFAGRVFDQALLDALPLGVDPCGEAGEFHTFAWDGPGFGHPVPVTPGEVVTRDGFVFADLLPQGDA